MSVLRLILGDQLNESISSLSDIDPQHDLIVMCELQEEATYVKHHVKKLVFVFSAMRHFAASLESKGYPVRYIKWMEHPALNTFTEVCADVLKSRSFSKIVVTHPGEYRVLKALQVAEAALGLPIEIRGDDRFLCDIEEFSNWAQGRKQLRMEYFYRDMRKKYSILITEKGKPVGGQWNYDADNRHPPSDTLTIPPPSHIEPDDLTQTVIELVGLNFKAHFGSLENFGFAVTRQDALKVLEQFTVERLPCFGDYQDAMLQGEPWMYHAHIGLYLNSGLLLPQECINAALAAYESNQAPLNAVEGFIRQLLGWREYIRGIYWLKMPNYAEYNFLNAQRALPEYYWTGNTQMNCLKQCVDQTAQTAYAHHIQRLMVLGNFAALIDVHPKALNEWFLSVYVDAYEWVELPNVSGMVLFADGGILASKPYVSGGAYIHKMSNYCQSCHYRVKEKNGPKACPFNYLYWDFLVRHRDHLKDHPRIAMMYRMYERMSPEKQQAISNDAANFLEHST